MSLLQTLPALPSMQQASLHHISKGWKMKDWCPMILLLIKNFTFSPCCACPPTGRSLSWEGTGKEEISWPRIADESRLLLRSVIRAAILGEGPSFTFQFSRGWESKTRPYRPYLVSPPSSLSSSSSSFSSKLESIELLSQWIHFL